MGYMNNGLATYFQDTLDGGVKNRTRQTSAHDLGAGQKLAFQMHFFMEILHG